jgi:ABC-type sugar transport system ATPase subunit
VEERVDSGTKCLEFKNVSKEFPGVRALSDVSFSVDCGEVHALMGANGAGKSTLIKILARVLQQTHGDVLVLGESVSKAGARNIRTFGIDFVFQELELVPGFTAAQNIMIGIEPRMKTGFVDWKRMIREAQEALDSFMPGAVDASAQVLELSVAQQQIVCIIRALYRDPKILVLDEPTSRLSASETDALFDAIGRLRAERDITILYVSHRLEEIFRICDRVTVLRDGVYTGTWALGDITREEVVYKMVGEVQSSESCRLPSQELQDLTPELAVEDLSISGLIENVSFEVKPGQVVALTGAVGSRKTELIDAIIGIREKSGGRVLIRGAEVNLNSPYSAKKHGICLIPEDRRRHGVISDFSVRENTTIAFLREFTNRLHLISQRQETRTVRELCAKLDVKMPSTEVAVKTLSGGNIQKVLVAKWLIGDSNVYFFDEPTVGIDVKGKSEIHALIRELAAGGKAVVVASSDVDEAINVSDLMIVLFGGRVVGRRISCEASREEVVYMTMGGRTSA